MDRHNILIKIRVSTCMSAILKFQPVERSYSKKIRWTYGKTLYGLYKRMAVAYLFFTLFQWGYLEQRDGWWLVFDLLMALCGWFCLRKIQVLWKHHVKPRYLVPFYNMLAAITINMLLHLFVFILWPTISQPVLSHKSSILLSALIFYYLLTRYLDMSTFSSIWLTLIPIFLTIATIWINYVPLFVAWLTMAYLAYLLLFRCVWGMQSQVRLKKNKKREQKMKIKNNRENGGQEVEDETQSE